MRSWASKVGGAAAIALITCLALEFLSDQRPLGLPTAAAGNQGIVDSREDSYRIESTMLPTGYQQIVLIDTTNQTMACYHIEPAGGKIQLKSVRRFTWDFTMEEFNAESPLPSELRAVQP